MKQLLQHSRIKKHMALAVSLSNPKQSKFKINSKGTSTPALIQLESLTNTFTEKEKVLKAKILWCFKVVASAYSFSSCQEISTVFQCMFPDSNIAQKLLMSRSKISYIISHGLGPYVHEELVNDLKMNTFFTIEVDETTNAQVKKQLDVYVRFWSETSNRVIVQYFDSVMMGHATAEQLKVEIMRLLLNDNLPLDKVLSISMDGPNVNKKMYDLLEKEFRNVGSKGLVNIGTCNLHPVHTAFRKALDTLNFDIDQFVLDAFGWFKLSSARRDDFKEILSLYELADTFFCRHVSSRWLTLGSVVERIILMFEPMKKYFLEYLHKNQPKAIQSNQQRYQRIKSALQDPKTLVYLCFVRSQCETFSPFLHIFQSEEPLIHILYNKMNELVRLVLCKFIKSEIVGCIEGNILASLDLDVSSAWISLRKMDIGTEAKEHMQHVPSDSQQKLLLLEMRSFFSVAAKYLIVNLPIANQTLRDLQCLHPLVRVKQESKDAIQRLAKKMNNVVYESNKIDEISVQWSIYQQEAQINESWFCKKEKQENGEEIISWLRIDEYWSKVLDIRSETGVSKFSSLSILIKACLSLSHGNADVERGFSLNNNIVTKQRVSLSNDSIKGMRNVKDFVIKYNNNLSAIPITKKMIQACGHSYSLYLAKLQEEKEKKIEIEKRKIEEAIKRKIMEE